jgi:hypothetical protein
MGSKRPNDGVYLMTRPAGHDASVVHSFNHTGGECPKCSSKRHHVVFCLPGQSAVPRVSSCEVDGEHLHRQCGDCGYPWAERCYDQLLLSQEEGTVLVESRLLAALACLADRSKGISIDERVIAGYRGWTIRFRQDLATGAVTITAEETPDAGKPTHPELRTGGASNQGGAA